MAEPASKESPNGRSSPRARRARFGAVARGIVALAALLLVAGWVLARTPQGRRLASGWLTKKLGCELTIERTRIGWPYDGVWEGVRTADYEPHRAGARAAEVRIGWRGGSRWAISVRGAELNLVRSADGAWSPQIFAPLGGLPDGTIADLSRLTAALRDRIRLRVRDSEVRWIESKHGEHAAARGVNLDLIPVRIPNVPLFYYDLSAADVRDAAGRRLRDIRRVWLASPDNPYLELERSGPSVSGEVGGFWSPGPSASREEDE